MPLGFPSEGLASGMRYQPASSDIFVCTYPKCGTTWVQYIVYLLVRGRPIAADEALDRLFPHLEEVGSEVIAASAEPRLIKTHLPYSMTPQSREAKYVVVARNPFDCAVSFYYHTRGFPRHYDFADGQFDEFFQCFLSGEVDFGDYFDHLLSWHEAAAEENIYFLTYEALKHDPKRQIGLLGAFLGGPAAAITTDEKALDAVIAESSFTSMRRDQQRWSSERPAELPFVRRGKVGEWDAVMTPEQTARLLAKFKERTDGSETSRLWPDIMAAAGRHARSA